MILAPDRDPEQAPSASPPLPGAPARPPGALQGPNPANGRPAPGAGGAQGRDGCPNPTCPNRRRLHQAMAMVRDLARMMADSTAQKGA
jgi:hypothetical protein